MEGSCVEISRKKGKRKKNITIRIPFHLLVPIPGSNVTGIQPNLDVTELWAQSWCVNYVDMGSSPRFGSSWLLVRSWLNGRKIIPEFMDKSVFYWRKSRIAHRWLFLDYVAYVVLFCLPTSKHFSVFAKLWLLIARDEFEVCIIIAKKKKERPTFCQIARVQKYALHPCNNVHALKTAAETSYFTLKLLHFFAALQSKRNGQ